MKILKLHIFTKKHKIPLIQKYKFILAKTNLLYTKSQVT